MSNLLGKYHCIFERVIKLKHFNLTLYIKKSEKEGIKGKCP